MSVIQELFLEVFTNSGCNLSINEQKNKETEK